MADLMAECLAELDRRDAQLLAWTPGLPIPRFDAAAIHGWQAILALHQPFTVGDTVCCSTCDDSGPHVGHPCPTVQAIATALGVTE